MNRGTAEHDHDLVVRGILCRIGSGLSFATMGALLKLASTEGMNAPELVFYRSVFSLPVVLAWVLKRSPVMLPIPGTSSVKHLEENTAAAHLELSDEDFAELDAQGKKEWKAQAGRG